MRGVQLGVIKDFLNELVQLPSEPRTSGLAGFWNCPSMNELGVEAAIWLALAMHPVIPLEGSVRTKVAPNALWH